MKQNLFDEITAEKIRSKTTDEAIAKTFRLDWLDQIAEQTKPKAKRGVRFQIPRINRDGDIDYAPEVDPYGGGAKVQVTGHRTGHRSQVTGQNEKYL